MVRTRFAPSPSGLLHLGNARSMILSYIAAKQDSGVFLLRIEDTDQQRTADIFLQKIFFYMKWLSVLPDEGPQEGGEYAPYIQSQRTQIYQEYLEKLIQLKAVYRCFKTQEELEKTRAYQIARHLPPRYERPVYADDYVYQESEASKGTPFVWRYKVPQSGTTKIVDKARGEVVYECAQFADFPLTRQDGSFTFIFANFVDDVTMNISLITRGEEHFSNSALQSCLYDTFNVKKPILYHLPLLCDKQGKKLSKRDFGFSLDDLISGGFLPQAIINYLITMGGSFEKEIFSLHDAINNRYFDAMHSTGSIKYDVDKLTWINKKWIQQLSEHDLIHALSEFMIITNTEEQLFNMIITLFKTYNELLIDIQKESENLKDIFQYGQYFLPTYNFEKENTQQIKNIAQQFHNICNMHETLGFDIIKKEMVKTFPEISLKDIIKTMRYILIGSYEGIGVGILLKHINKGLLKNRIEQFLK